MTEGTRAIIKGIAREVLEVYKAEMAETTDAKIQSHQDGCPARRVWLIVLLLSGVANAVAIILAARFWK